MLKYISLSLEKIAQVQKSHLKLCQNCIRCVQNFVTFVLPLQKKTVEKSACVVIL